MPVGLESQVVQRIGLVILRAIKATDLTAVMPQRVNYFVFENADQPGLELRAVSKRLWSGQRYQQSLRYGVLSSPLVSQLKAGKAQQIVTVSNQLLFKGRW